MTNFDSSGKVMAGVCLLLVMSRCFEFVSDQAENFYRDLRRYFFLTISKLIYYELILCIIHLINVMPLKIECAVLFYLFFTTKSRTRVRIVTNRILFTELGHHLRSMRFVN